MDKDYNLEFDTLNKELIPLIDQYKQAQDVYQNAINDGGCFLTINGSCKKEPILSNHPFFQEEGEKSKTLEDCFKKQEKLQKICNNKNIDSIFIDQNNHDLINSTAPILQQLNMMNTLIIDKFNQIQKLNQNNKTLKFGEKLTREREVGKQIDKLLDQKRKLKYIHPELDESSDLKLNTNYIKFVFWVSLVILGIGLFFIIYGKSENYLLNIIKFVLVVIGLYFTYNNHFMLLYIVIFGIIIYSIFF